MKRTWILAAGLAGGLTFLSFASQEPAAEEGDLHEHMEEIEDAMKHLRRAVRDAEQHGPALAHVERLQRASLASKSLEPPMVDQVPEDERAEFVKDYRRQMVALLQKQLELELAMLDGNVDLARELHAELGDMEDSGHERFTPEED